MGLFQKAVNNQAFMKAGIMGFAGSGKSFTASHLAIGLVHLMRQRDLPHGHRPVFFLDTETGADWVQPFFYEAGIELFTAKTRAFRDLIPAVNEAQDSASVLIIDSISHFWRELCDSYAERKNRRRGLEFQDWAWLKTQWHRFTDSYVNSQAHIILCGRAGFEYDYFERDNGKKELEKTGIKMKAETETGYEPSLLVLMEREMDLDTRRVSHVAHILKDRSTRLDGKAIKNPSFEDFLPHIECLNLGGVQLGVDTERTSKEMISPDEKSEYQRDRERAEIVLDEIKELIGKHWGGQTQEAKLKRGDLMEKHFGTRSWVKIEKTYRLAQLQEGYNGLHLELEGLPAYFHKDSAGNVSAAIKEMDADLKTDIGQSEASA